MKTPTHNYRLKTLLLLCATPFFAFSQLTFTNVAGVGSDDSNISGSKDGGCSFSDYDLDGDLDLLVNTSSGNDSYLLRNDNGVFTDVTAAVASGLKTSNTERTAAWGDCNNDGYPDILVNSSGRLKILLNDAGTSFNIIIDTNTMTDGFNTEGAGWIDFDMDGDLDFFLENHDNGVDLFENDGSTPTPVFTQITINSVGAANTGAGGTGLPEGGSTTGDYGSSCDLNADGYPDILVRRQNSGPDTGVDRNRHDIFINDGDGTFTANGTVDEEANNSNKGSVVTGDFDGDGDFDILWTSASSSGNRTVIYENTGMNSMVFALIANPFMLDGGGLENGNTFDGCAIGDIDNDNDLDIFLTEGSGTSKLFLNQSTGPGNFSFRQPGPTWIAGAAVNYGINLSGNGEGCVFGDFDNDGDEDLYINKTGTNQLWRNNYIGSATESAAAYQNNYLRVIAMVDLGGGRERPALNATVTFLDCEGNTIGGIREVGAGGAGHGSQTSPWLILGLPNGPDVAYTIEVQFTRNGTTPIRVKKSLIPADLADLSLGATTMDLEQTIVIMDTDADDITSCPEICADGIDNDGDGLVDCEDPECNLRGNGYDWYFGQNASLDFEFASGPVQGELSAMNAEEGCAQWSDPSGKMLFYTNGITVFNRLHQAMPNGTGLNGNPSMTQTGVIVENPGNADQYYIVHINGSSANAYYTIVDMSLDGGKGDIVVARKNVFIRSISGEKIAAWVHSNGTDRWIALVDQNNLYAYQISAGGLSAVVTSPATSLGRTYGQMKFGPYGNQLAMACYPNSFSNYRVQLFDFDKSTGLFSNKREWALDEPYGLEFSPNGNLLYVTDMGWGSSPGRILQYDLNGNSTGADILATEQVLLSANYLHAALQHGPDGKIYMASSVVGNNPRNGLAVINAPNTLGAGANAVADQITFTGGAMSRSGLPNIPYYQLINEPAISFVSATDTCFADGNVVFEAYASGATSYQWLLNGLAIPGEVNDTFAPLDYGNYQVISFFACGSDTSAVLTLKSDNDGDCYADCIDLDDDNDGLYDSEECPLTLASFTGASLGTVTSGSASADYILTENSTSGYASMSISSVAAGLQIQGNSTGGGNDMMDYTLSLSNVTAGYIPLIRLVQRPGGSGNSEGSTFTLNWTGGSGSAQYFDMATPDNGVYRYGVPASFDNNNRQVVGLDEIGTIINGGSMETYAVYNNQAEWYVEFPLGINSVSINKSVFNFGTSTSAGKDHRFPLLGYASAANSGESFNEWMTFQVIFQPDTDGDGIVDCKDTDSDGDGCFDAIEAGFTDANEDGEVDGTGIASDGTVIGSDGYTGTDPIVTDFNLVALSCDTDGDGVNPVVDLDDDNDGIYDDEECGATIVNGGFELNTGVSNGNNFVGSVAPWALVVGSHNLIHVDGAGPFVYGNGGPEFDARGGEGNYYDVNAAAGILYQSFTVSVTSTILYEGYFSPRDGDVGTGHIEIRQGTGAGGALISSTNTISSNDNTIWHYLSEIIVLDPGTYSYLAILSDPMNFDEARVRGLSCSVDSDGDGVQDSYDLDSDNDGIYDVIEGGSGALDTNGDGVIDSIDTGFSDTNQDGIDDDAALITPTDSDGDGIIDAIELDSDNDGCFDVNEAGYADPDGNGLLGTGN